MAPRRPLSRGRLLHAVACLINIAQLSAGERLFVDDAGWHSGNADFSVRIDLQQVAPGSQMRPEFLSTTIDVSLLTHPVHCDWQSPRLITMAKALSSAGPMWLRVGGTKGDKLWYDMSGGPPRSPPNSTLYPGGTFNKSVWDMTAQFAMDIDFQIAFGINLGPGPRDQETGAWRPDNALEFMNYTKAKGYPVIGYEAGNEPDMFDSVFKDLGFYVKPSQYARDVALFAETVKAVNSSLITIAPDSNYVPIIGDFLYLESMLRSAKEQNLTSQVDVWSWHFYPTLAPAEYNKSTVPFILWPFFSHPQLMLNASVLDMVHMYGSFVRDIVDRDGRQGAEVWLGETGSAVGGGAANVSNAFADGFEYLDKLGAMALHGHGVVFRQTICGYNYGFVNFDLQPMPSFFVALLFKRLVGTSPLVVHVDDERTDSATSLRVYSFCAAPAAGPEGAVVVIAININPAASAQFAISDEQGSIAGERHEYVLTAPQGLAGLGESSIALNGTVLQVAEDGTPPPMQPVVVANNAEAEAVLPPASYGFFVLPEAHAAACEL